PTGHRPEAPRVVPWFKEAYQGPAVSTCKVRWVAIRKGNRTVYAQWEDAGQFRTDHWQYVFGNERPKPNLNKGAGLDVSPAVRDYLGLKPTDFTDWRFLDFKEVPRGPWSTHRENNTFVINDRAKGKALVERLSTIARERKRPAGSMLSVSRLQRIFLPDTPWVHSLMSDADVKASGAKGFCCFLAFQMRLNSNENRRTP